MHYFIYCVRRLIAHANFRYLNIQYSSPNFDALKLRKITQGQQYKSCVIDKIVRNLLANGSRED